MSPSMLALICMIPTQGWYTPRHVAPWCCAYWCHQPQPFGPLDPIDLDLWRHSLLCPNFFQSCQKKTTKMQKKQKTKKTGAFGDPRLPKPLNPTVFGDGANLGGQHIGWAIATVQSRCHLCKLLWMSCGEKKEEGTPFHPYEWSCKVGGWDPGAS